MKKVLRKSLKIITWVLSSVLLLLIIVFILIQVPGVQNFARKKVVSYLVGKIHTKVEISKLSLDFPKRLVLEGVFFEDQKKDTLLYGGNIQVDIALLKLIKSHVEISYIGLSDFNARIYRTGNDTVFNYQYIINAFVTPTTEPEDTSTGMKISLNKINLENIRASFKDDQTGMDFSGSVGKFQTAFKKFDLDKMNYSLPYILLANVSGHLYQNKPLLAEQSAAVVEAESNEPFNLQLELNNINLNNIGFDYRNDVSVMAADLNLGELSAKVKLLDLAKLDVQLEKVKLHNTTARIILGKSAQTQIVKEEINKEVAAQANNPWKVILKTMDFENNNIVFRDENKPKAQGMDFANLIIDSFKLKGHDFVFTPTSYAGSITEGGFREHSGFYLKQFTTDFNYSDTGAALQNLLVQTDQTIIRDNITVRYPSIVAVTKDPGKLYLDINFAKSNLATKDILLLAPQLRTYLKGNENVVVHINAKVKGYVNDLTIPGFEVSGVGNTSIAMSGTIKGLPDAKKAVYAFNIAHFQTTKADLNKFLPAGTIPPGIRLPGIMKVNGIFKGLASNFTTNLVLHTNKGTASLDGFLNSNNETYNLKGSLNNVDVGYFIKQDTMIGKVTLTFTAKGQGFTPAKMNTIANARVKAAYLNGYNYRDLDVIASIHKGYTSIDAGMSDKNLAFKLKGQALIDDKFATNIKMRLMLDSILMKPLGFSDTDLRIHGNVLADMATTDLNVPQGIIQIAELIVSNNKQRFEADTITVNAATSDTGKVITLNSQIATATLSGNYNLATLGTGALQEINKYYNLGIKDTATVTHKWNLDATIIPDSLLFVIAPALAGTDTIKINASFDGSKEKLNLLVRAPKIQLGEQVLDSLTITAGNAGDKLVYAAGVNTAGSKSFRLYRTHVDGFIANNELYTKLNIKDMEGKDKYQLGTKVAQEKDGAIRASLSDTLMLDFQNWSVDNSNYIKYDSTGIIVHNFNLDHEGQSLRINSQAENVTAPIELSLGNFHIKTLTNLAEQDSLLLDGVISGNVVVKNALTAPLFTADIKVDSLAYKKEAIGNIIVKVDNETANAFNTNVSISGNGNDVKLAGKYYTGDSRMDMKLNVNNFNLASIKPLTFGALTQADGNLKGAVEIKGTTADPDLNGELRFENANITPKATGEKLHLSDEAISISSREINFNKFTLIDSAGNKAIIDGNIGTTNFKSYDFNLGVNAENFRLLKAPPRQNALYYGDLNMDAAISVKGTLTAPIVNADLTINKLTDITFVLPGNNPEIESRTGVVLFEDIYGAKTDSILKTAIDTLTSFPELAGLDFTGTLQSDTAAQITLVIDERSGDALKIQGKANLAAALDKSGKMSLTGNYELQNGSYQLTLSLLKKQFLIQQGSLITWMGDPMSADVDITAVYIANTQPINLLQSELSSSSAAAKGKYKGKVPFNVLLKMKGELLKPVISFDIELPGEQKSKWADVEAKLEQVRRDDAELNKQVFALLLLGRFVQENPLANAAEGTSLATKAKSSVSRLLTEQLNNLAGSLVKGVDLNFGVNAEDDFSSGTRTSRTDLTVGVSKNLLNDRLRVSVGSNFELEGPANSNQNATNIAGDVAVDYLLTTDGRYALRGYRRSNYQDVIVGQIIESGASFIFSLDFNKFKQIVSPKTKEQKLEKAAEKERKKKARKKTK